MLIFLDADGNVMYKKVNYLTDSLTLRDDGTTSAGNWIYVGQWTEKGNQTANRDNSDPSGLGLYIRLGLRMASKTVVSFIAVLHLILTVTLGINTVN